MRELTTIELDAEKKAFASEVEETRKVIEKEKEDWAKEKSQV